MNENYLYYSLILISTILAMVNVWKYKDYKALSIKDKLNELKITTLEQKLKDCEQRRLNGISECPHD